MSEYKMNSCDFCNKKIEIKRSRDKNKKYCSRKCAAKDSSNVPVEPCPNCGKDVKRIKNGGNERKKFCSRSCSNKFRSINRTRICKGCGEKFKLKNISYEKRGNGLYCSRSCASRKYELNEHFFENIDTKEKGYWLGFIFADGCNTGNGVTLRISKKDKEHLKKFKSCINCEHPIKSDEDVSSLRIYSKKISNNLKRLGCVQNKTHKIRFPKKLPNKYKFDFIRGYFDGDGHIRKSGLRFNIYSGSLKFIDEVSKILKKENLNHSRGDNTIDIYRKDDCKNFGNLIYENKEPCLERKYKIYKSHL